MNQHDLARIILLLIGRPVSKIRLARLIYFTHKDLIRKKLLSPSDILYIRSPLGPIPDGYTTLTLESDDIIAQRNTSSNLSCASEDYAISERALEAEATLLEQYRDMLAVIESTLKILQPYKTPELIEITHREPSWLAHRNGEIYQISPQDLKLTFPEQKPLHIKINFIPIKTKPKSPENKLGAMQAHLLRGMIADIVKESTDLEYPDDPATKNPPEQAKKRSGLPIIRFKITRKRPNHTPSPEQKESPSQGTPEAKKGQNSNGHAQNQENHPQTRTNTEQNDSAEGSRE